MDLKTRWVTYFNALDANGNGFLEPEDATLVAKVSKLFFVMLLIVGVVQQQQQN